LVTVRVRVGWLFKVKDGGSEGRIFRPLHSRTRANPRVPKGETMSEGLWGGLTEAHSNSIQSCPDHSHAVPIRLSAPYYDPAVQTHTAEGTSLQRYSKATPIGRQSFIVRPRTSYVAFTIYYKPINTSSLLFMLIVALKAKKKEKIKEIKICLIAN